MSWGAWVGQPWGLGLYGWVRWDKVAMYMCRVWNITLSILLSNVMHIHIWNYITESSLSFLMHQIFHFLKVVNTMAYVKLLNSQFLFLLLQIAYTKYVQVVSLDFCTNWLLIPVCRPCNVIKLKTKRFSNWDDLDGASFTFACWTISHVKICDYMVGMCKSTEYIQWRVRWAHYHVQESLSYYIWDNSNVTSIPMESSFHLAWLHPSNIHTGLLTKSHLTYA